MLARNIPDTPYSDAIGPYPLLCCQDWTALADDLEGEGGELITMTAVSDPLAPASLSLLKQAFPDLVLPYKEHFVAELKGLAAAVDKRHIRKARRALESVTVERVERPASALDDWTQLYASLVRKHGIVGLSAFSRASFARQLEVPGAVLYRAVENGQAVAATFWFVDGEQAYYHLGASSDRGYELGASFALMWVALNAFAEQGVGVVLLGAGAGVYNDGSDGLSRFKAGWATGTRQSYLCGRIFNPAVYRQLNGARSSGETTYFPAYRAHLAGL